MSKLKHIATIDYCYWKLGVLNKRLSRPKSNIEKLVDKTCGYNETKDTKKEVISLIEQIIESKKAIGADYSGNNKSLDEIKRITI